MEQKVLGFSHLLVMVCRRVQLILLHFSSCFSISIEAFFAIFSVLQMKLTKRTRSQCGPLTFEHVVQLQQQNNSYTCESIIMAGRHMVTTTYIASFFANEHVILRSREAAEKSGGRGGGQTCLTENGPAKSRYFAHTFLPIMVLPVYM